MFLFAGALTSRSSSMMFDTKQKIMQSRTSYRAREAQRRLKNTENSVHEARKPPKRLDQQSNDGKRSGQGTRTIVPKTGFDLPKSFDLGRFHPTKFTALFFIFLGPFATAPDGPEQPGQAWSAPERPRAAQSPERPGVVSWQRQSKLPFMTFKLGVHR